VSKEKFPKSDCKCELVTFRWTFVSITRVRSCSRAYDFTLENWIIGHRYGGAKAGKILRQQTLWPSDIPMSDGLITEQTVGPATNSVFVTAQASSINKWKKT